MTTADGSVLGVTKVLDNGPASQRWNLVIAGDGFTTAQQPAFNTAVDRFVALLLRTSPFDELRRAINVYRINVSSRDSGADDPAECGGSGATPRTYFDASFCNGGLRRLLLVDDFTAIDTASAKVPEWSMVMVVVNSPEFGGAGGGVATFSLAADADETALHEMGHTAFGLADEYEYYAGCGVDTDHDRHPAVEPAEPNVTVTADRARLKWRKFVAASTPLPTTRNADCSDCDPQPDPQPPGTIGAFEGAHYYHCRAYRPAFDCKMRALGHPFCAVCRAHIREVLAPYLPPGLPPLRPVAVTAPAAGRLDVLIRGTGRALHHKRWNGSSWLPGTTSFEGRGGVLASFPDAAARSPDRLDVVVVGTDGAVWRTAPSGSAWTPGPATFQRLGGAVTGQPSIVAPSPDRLHLFVTGPDRALYHKRSDGSAWYPSLTGYERLGGVIVGSPTAVSWGPGRADVFVVGSDRALYHKWWDGSAWRPGVTGYERLGGRVNGQPVVVAGAPGHLHVFVVGDDGALYHKWWDGAWHPGVTGYERLGGAVLGSPTAASWGPDRVDVFVVGSDRALYHKWWDGSAWRPSASGYEHLGGVVSASPTAVTWGPGRLDVFVVGTDRGVWHKWWDGSAWRPSVTGFERRGGAVDL